MGRVQTVRLACCLASAAVLGTAALHPCPLACQSLLPCPVHLAQLHPTASPPPPSSFLDAHGIEQQGRTAEQLTTLRWALGRDEDVGEGTSQSVVWCAVLPT